MEETVAMKKLARFEAAVNGLMAVLLSCMGLFSFLPMLYFVIYLTLVLLGGRGAVSLLIHLAHFPWSN